MVSNSAPIMKNQDEQKFVVSSLANNQFVEYHRLSQADILVLTGRLG
jgi:hypothetical protein